MSRRHVRSASSSSPNWRRSATPFDCLSGYKPRGRVRKGLQARDHRRCCLGRVREVPVPHHRGRDARHGYEAWRGQRRSAAEVALKRYGEDRHVIYPCTPFSRESSAGLSHYPVGVDVGLGAAALGACVVEKRLTTSRSGRGRTISYRFSPGNWRNPSMEPGHLLWQEVGVDRPPHRGARDRLPVCQRSDDHGRGGRPGVVAGQRVVKRPGDGPIMVRELESVLGRVARRGLSAIFKVSPEDFV